MPDVQQQRQSAPIDLHLPTIQPPDQASIRQSASNLFDAPLRLKQNESLQGQRGIFHRQIKQRQLIQGEAIALDAAAAPAPTGTLDSEIEIAPANAQLDTQGVGVLQKIGRRLRITAQRRTPTAHDPRFLAGHRLATVAEPFGVIHADASDERKISIDQVDRIQPPAQADFEHRDVQLGLLEQPECCERAHLEVGQAGIAARRLDR